MDRELLEKLYLRDHLTLGEIAKIQGCSRQNIHAYTKKYGFKAHDAEWVKFKCHTCNQNAETTRKAYQASILHFCSAVCYKRYLKNPDYRQSRNGQRLGRMVVEKQRGYSMRPGEVVHHIDGDTMNNAPSNLMVFKSHSEHIAHHHKVRRENELQS